ncbi:MAG: FCD domain-containing protein [Oscillospiraceae bacterium]
MNIDEYNKKPLAEKVSDDIIDYIAEHDLEIGERIPSEYELASMLQVGRGTVREAIRALISRNILVIRRGAGTFIASKSGTMDDPLGLAFMKDKHKLALDLLEIRFMTEPSIAAMAAENATDEDIAELERLDHAVDALILEHKNHANKDIEFHAKLASCSKNSVVPNLVPIISASVELFTSLTKRRLLEETIYTHREIVEAIKAHNTLAAHDAMMMHLVFNRHRIKELDFK